MRILPIGLLALVGAALAGCGENAVPTNVSYMAEIKPLMEAHCVRCHGAGGTLNNDPDVPPGTKVCPPVAAGAPFTCAPINGIFNSLADVNGKHGLMFYTGTGAATLQAYVTTTFGPMPPLPSEQLTDYEYNLLMTWANRPLP